MSTNEEDFDLEQFQQETHEHLQRSHQQHEADVERKVARLRKREHNKWENKVREELDQRLEWARQRVEAEKQRLEEERQQAQAGLKKVYRMESIEELLQAVRAGTPSTDPDVQLCMRVLMQIEPANSADEPKTASCLNQQDEDEKNESEAAS